MFVQRQSGGPGDGLGRLYLSDSQREVIATLRRGLARPRGITALSGDAGLGKTTLVGAVMDELGEPVRTVEVPKDDALAALRDLQASTTPASGGILVVDNAHLLPADALRRLFAAFEQSQPNPVRLVLVARSSFWSMLASPAMAAVRDRIDTRAVLFSMSYNEAELYVEHLFGLAGASSAAVLPREALHGLILRAQGNPQRLNVELDRVLRGQPPKPPEAEAPVVAAAPAAAAASKRPVGRIVAVGLALGTVALALWATTMPFQAPAPAVGDAAPMQQAPMQQAPMQQAPMQQANPPPAALPAIPAGPAAPVLPPFSETRVPAADVAPWVAPDEAGAAAPAMASEPVPDAAEAIEPSDAPTETAALPARTSSDAPRPPAAPSLERLEPAVVALLLRRGSEMLDLHDISAARRLFERAALAGSSTAAFALGDTYDPSRRGGNADVDARLARRWYELAAERGDEEAARRLDALDSAKATE